MTKRDEAIGRAAHGAEHATTFDDLMRGAKEGWTRIGLAAVAEARRIDTCGTCKSEDMAERVGGSIKEWCNRFGIWTADIGRCGCNRHEPKGE